MHFRLAGNSLREQRTTHRRDQIWYRASRSGKSTQSEDVAQWLRTSRGVWTMPRRSHPTARQVRLGAELKKLRQRAGLSGGNAARLAGMDQAKLTHLEAGRVAVSPETVRRLAAQYDLADSELAEALAQMAEEGTHGWWNSYKGVLPRGFLDLAEMEHYATSLRTVEVTQVPGLLQTEDHARAVFENGLSNALPQRDLDARVAHRMERGRVLQREQPVPFEAVIHEAALRIRVAGRAVARGQLNALAASAELDHVTIRVIPFDIDGFATAGYAMLYLKGAATQLDTVQLDHVHGGVFLHGEQELTKHRRFYERVRARSLGPTESRTFIRKVAEET